MKIKGFRFLVVSAVSAAVLIIAGRAVSYAAELIKVDSNLSMFGCMLSSYILDWEEIRWK